jgi:CubicO group peptidase (beta-lactamase class C family)
MQILHSSRTSFLTVVGLVLAGITAFAQAQQTSEPRASAPPVQLDPSRLMQGFPPPPEYRVDVGNWQRWPHKIWSFRHTRELFPSRGLSPSGAVWTLPFNPIELDDLQVGTSAKPMTWPEMLTQTHVDASLVLYKGQVVDERYFNGMKPEDPHLMFSATKSMVGLMAAVLMAEGKLDPQARVGQLIPELSTSAWGEASVQQVLDMTDGVRFTEIYTDPKSDIFAYVGAMGWAPELAKPGTPKGIQSMLPTLQHLLPEGRGVAFRYRSAATDVAAWLAMRAANQSVTQWFQNRIWSRLGMEHEGNILLDPAGTEVAFAGMSASLRDLGRLGEMLLQRGRYNGEQIIPAKVVDDLAQGGDVRAFELSGFNHLKGWSYRNQWWVNPGQPRSFVAKGAYGQRLYVFPEAETVIVLLGSHPSPASAPLIDPIQQQAFKVLLQKLQEKVAK